MLAIILKSHRLHHYPPYHHREGVAIKLLLLLLMNYLDLREWRARQLETAKEKKTRQEQIQQLRRAQVFGLVTWLSSVSFESCLAGGTEAAGGGRGGDREQGSYQDHLNIEIFLINLVPVKIISVFKHF